MALSNQKGVSLVELMIAVVILLFVSLALMQTALMSIEANMKNVLRDEAVSVADGRMSEARNLTFTALADTLQPDALADSTLTAAACPASFWTTFGPRGGVLLRKSLRNWSTVSFCTNRDVINLGSQNKQVTINVGWSYRGQDFSHAMTTIVGMK